MVVYIKSRQDFEKEIVNSSIPTLVDFWASWCMPCTMMAPVFEELSKEYDGRIKFVKLSTEEFPDLAQDYEIDSIPAMLLLNKGKEVDRLIGYMPKPIFKARVEDLIRRHPELFRK